MSGLKLISFLLLMWVVACNDKPSTPGTPDSTLTVTPGAFEITILEPSADGASISLSGVLSGDCGKPQYPITIVGNGMTIYSVCQNDYHWVAPVSAKNAAEGIVSYSVTLRDLNLTGGSSSVIRTFQKVDAICQTATNLSKPFANSEVANGTTVPYKICTAQQFSNIRYYADKKFQLAQNIDFSLSTISPIPTTFSGELDGRGFMLKDFIVKDIGGTNISVGLFKVAQNATIKNLVIMNGRVESSERIGLLAGDWRGTGVISNVKATGEVVGTAYVGGLIGLGNTTSALQFSNVKTQLTVTGNNYTGGVVAVINTNDGSLSVENSEFYNTVTGQDHVGGFAGSVSEDNTTMTNVLHRGVISSSGIDVGGLIGDVKGGTFSNIRHIGSVGTTKDNVNSFVGGLFGETLGPATISGSNAVSTITSGGHFVGGLVGRFYSGSINSSYTRGSITVNENTTNGIMSAVGGLIGATQLDTTISQSYSQSNILGRSYSMGGLVGIMNGAASSLNECYSTGTLNGNTRLIGGLVGDFKGQSITNSFSRSNINVDTPTPNAYLGGLVGYALTPAGSYSRLYYSGTMTITNGTADIVGGLFGYVKATTLKELYFSGSIQGPRGRVGGLAGQIVDANLSASFSMGSVTASLREVGGLVGAFSNGSMLDSFSVATVQGSGNLGGLIGWAAGTHHIARSYFAGTLYKNASSVESDSQIGRLVGLKDTSVTYADIFYYDLGVARRLSDNTTIPSNNIGVLRTSSQLRNQTDYTNFNFTNNASAFDWDMPLAGFKLPGQSSDYLYAIQDWLSLANFGFNLPTIWSDDPQNAVIKPLLDTYGGSLSSLTQDEYDALTTSSAPTSVTAGQLQISILEPSADGAPIATKKLVYGECGVPGGVVKLTGDFIVNTICQTNYRWAAIIDATNEASGNLTLAVRLYNQAVTGNSSVVSRVLVKGNSLCSDSNALKRIYANYGTGGNGSTVPYVVCNGAQFRNMGYNPTLKYELASDIDFAGMYIEPIVATLKGTLDGKGFKVRNFVISRPGRQNIALFRDAEDYTLKNITFEKFAITGYDRTGVFVGSWRKGMTVQNVAFKNGSVLGVTYTGALAGMVNTQAAINLSQVTTNAITVSGNNYTGGLLGVVASNDGSMSMSNLTLAHTVSGQQYTGGLIGESLQPNATLTNIALTGNLTSTGTHVGGLIGHLQSATVTSATVTGNITSSEKDIDTFVGGVFGLVEASSTLSGLQYSGTLTAAGNQIGGLIGRLNVGTLTNAFSAGNLNVSSPTANSIRSAVGGAVGQIGQTVVAPAVSDPSTLDGVSSHMTVNAVATNVGGLVGNFGAPYSSIKNSFYNGASVTGRTAQVGGLIGIYHGKTAEDCYSTGNVTVDVPTQFAHVGGLIGYTNSRQAAYKRLWASGNVSASSGNPERMGGLLGYFLAGVLEDSYATGNVSGRIAIGGLVGVNRGVIQRSFATGSVTGALNYVGGLVGHHNVRLSSLVDSVNLPGVYPPFPLIEDSYSLGAVTAGGTASTHYSGGLVGYISVDAGQTNTVRRSYTRSTVSRAAGATVPMTSLGAIYGGASNAAMADNSTLYFLVTNTAGGQNNNGTALTAAQMLSPSNFLFDFASTPGWRMPDAATTVPGYGVSFPWPTLSWVGSGTTVNQYLVTGTITGLAHSSLTIQLNGGESKTISAGTTSFAFTGQLQTGQSYAVTISSQPTSPAITCTVANGSGTMGTANVTNIVISCPTFQSLAINVGTTAMAVGASQPFTVSATLSNTLIVDVTAQAANSISGTALVLTGTNINAQSAGAGTLTSTFLALSATRLINSYAAPAAPTGIAWSTASPSTTTTLTAQWVLSTTPTIASQRIDYYVGSACSGTPLTSKTLSASVTSDSYTGNDASTYYFKVRATDSTGVSSDSACSTGLLITTPTPSPVSGATVASSWKTGALPISSPIVSWTNPGSITGVKVALGTTAGGAELVGWGNIGLVTSYTYTNLSAVTECVPLYASIKTVNTYSKESTVVTAAAWKWDNSAPSVPGVPAISGVASSNVASIATWTASSDNCAFSQYQVAIGTTAGGSEIAAWHNVGNITTYQPTSGVNGITFTLSEGVNYYTSIRARDAAGNTSTISTSAAWQLPVTPLSKFMWFDATQTADIRDRSNLSPVDSGFTNRVYQWLDHGTNGSYDAYGATTTADAGYNSTNHNVTFNGTNQYLIIPSGTQFDNGTFTTKNMFVSFKTGIDITSRQVIFEQGNRNSGFNFYLLNGQLYCSFWNTSNGGDGAQAIIYAAQNVAANSTYHANFIFDYSNYTTATGPNGVFRCYVNGTQFGGDMVTTSRYFGAGTAGGAAFGATYGGTRYHDSNTNATGSYFAGSLLEAFSLTTMPTAGVITSVINSLMSKWSGGELSAPGSLALINNSTTTKAARASWQPISSSYFVTDHYEIAIGTSSGGTEVLYWSPIGNVTEYQPTDGVGGINFTLTYGVNYYFQVKAVDTFGNESLPAISNAWQVYPNSSLQLSGTILKLDASLRNTILDGANVTAETVGFAGVVATWVNAITAGTDNFTQTTAASRPSYISADNAVRFDQTNDSLSAASSTTLTNNTFTQKAITAVFTTGSDVSTRQFIIEQGSRNNRGMMIYLEANTLYCLFHNSKNGGDGAQAPIYQTTTITANTSYVVTLYLDYSNYTSATGANGTTGCYVNGVLQGTASTTSRLYPDTQAVFLGMRSGATWHNSNSNGAGDYFGGDILETQISNTVPSSAQSYIDLHNALMNKWQ